MIQILKYVSINLIKTLHISKNPLKEIQNNVFAPLSKLSNLIIHPVKNTLKHIRGNR
jgi:hypothetical protein